MSVAVLVYPGLLEIELGAALTAFTLGGGEGTARTVARSRASVVGFGGLVTTPELIFAALEPPQGVFVPGGGGAAKLSRDPLVKSFLRAQHERGARVAASGSGILALGEAGLLKGRAVATSPDLVDTVWGYNPAEVSPGGMSEDDLIVTAGGGLGALDAALALCVHFWGAETAREVGRRLDR